jgi:hypothetical protein
LPPEISGVSGDPALRKRLKSNRKIRNMLNSLFTHVISKIICRFFLHFEKFSSLQEFLPRKLISSKPEH